MTTLSFPIPISRLTEFLPHRPPAVWIDEVVSVNANGGIARVRFSESRNYATQGALRASSMIEWIAQAYGYIKASQSLLEISPQVSKASRTFMVGLKDFIFNGNVADIAVGQVFEIQVVKTHEVGPISLIKGEVRDQTGQVFAQGQIKLFAD